jgi:DNA-binding MarR family transcriptional regulator
MSPAPIDAALDPGRLAVELHPRLTRLTHLLRRETAHLPLSVQQGSVLRLLLDGPRRMGELASAERVQLPPMTQIVGRMERQGWVCRDVVASDRRRVEVRITTEGLALVREVVAVRTGILEQRLRQLPPDQLGALAAAIPAIDQLLEQ